MKTVVLITLIFLKYARTDFVNTRNHPYLVLIEISCVEKNSSTEILAFSQGSILNQNLVVTAATELARCDPSKTNMTVALWSTNITASRFKVHEKYELSNLTHVTCGSNIALVLLDHPIELGEKVKRVAVVRHDALEGHDVDMTMAYRWTAAGAMKTPFLVLLPSNVDDGFTIYLNGSVPENSDNFIINLQAQNKLEYIDREEYIFLHFRTFVYVNYTSVHHRTENFVGTAKELPHSLFVPGKSFELFIRCFWDRFEITVNNEPMYTYKNNMTNLLPNMSLAVMGTEGPAIDINVEHMRFIDSNGTAWEGIVLEEVWEKATDFNKCEKKEVQYIGACAESTICVQDTSKKYFSDSNEDYLTGAPLVAFDYVLLGVRIAPAQFTNVSFHHDWLVIAANDLYCAAAKVNCVNITDKQTLLLDDRRLLLEFSWSGDEKFINRIMT